MTSFPNFKGRRREWLRILPILQRMVGPELDSVFPHWPKAIAEHYRLDVPYHNHVHVAYGLLWLAYSSAPLEATIAYLMHDAGHNGIGRESPESMSANRALEALQTDDFRNAILHTVFPYVESTAGPPESWVQKRASTAAGEWIRLADTLRPYAGLSLHFLETGYASLIDAYLFESMGLHLELRLADGKTEFLPWMQNGQADFFPAQMDAAADAGSFGEIDAIWMHGRIEMTRRWVKEALADHSQRAALVALEEFWREDVTFPEFASKRIELGLPDVGTGV